MVDANWLDRVKAGGDAHPIIKAFTVAHEGNSENISLDGVRTPIQWMRDAIGWIKEKIQLHTPVFNHHGAPGDNSHEGRVSIGEIVGKKLTTVGNRVATIAALYIYPQYRNLPLDVASIEADITYAREGDRVWPTGIKQITGIALASSDLATPGFPHATLLGSIAAFAAGGSTMTVEEVKTAVGALSIKPEQLFSAEVLTGSEAVRGYIAQEKKDTREHARRVTEERDKLQQSNDVLQVKYDTDIGALQVKSMASQKSVVFDVIATERNLPDVEKQFASKTLRHFSTTATDEAGYKADLNKFVDGVLVDFTGLKPILGIKVEEGKGDGNAGDDAANQAASAAAKSAPSTLPDGRDFIPAQEKGMLDPEKNPLLPR